MAHNIGITCQCLIMSMFNPLNADPEYTRGQKMSPCRGPRVYSGAECFF